MAAHAARCGGDLFHRSISVPPSPSSAPTNGSAPARFASSTRTASNSASCLPSRHSRWPANAVPPVCRIQDYGKFLYEKDKSERAARKKQKVITIKEVKFSVTVDEHDYQTKKNMAIRFLGDGDKVKASLRFKGRQMAHRDLGYKIVNRLILDIGDAGMVEFMPRMEGTTLHAIIAPTKKAEAPPKKPAAEVAAKPADTKPAEAATPIALPDDTPPAQP
jgi:translation initiation factor IF-3